MPTAINPTMITAIAVPGPWPVLMMVDRWGIAPFSRYGTPGVPNLRDKRQARPDVPLAELQSVNSGFCFFL